MLERFPSTLIKTDPKKEFGNFSSLNLIFLSYLNRNNSPYTINLKEECNKNVHPYYLVHYFLLRFDLNCYPRFLFVSFFTVFFKHDIF